MMRFSRSYHDFHMINKIRILTLHLICLFMGQIYTSSTSHMAYKNLKKRFEME